MNQGTVKTKRYHLEKPIKIKEEITIEEIKIEPDTENPNSHTQSTSDEEQSFTFIPPFEQASTIRKVQSKTRANVRKRSNQGFSREYEIKNRFNLATTTDPKFQKPFLYGWRREVVYSRKDNDKATIVYWKGGKKFRTYAAIWRYLEETSDKNLTMDNFLFYQMPLGLDNKSEIIRLARPMKREWSKSLPKYRPLREIFKEKIIDKHKKDKEASKDTGKANEIDGKRSFKAASDPRLHEPFIHGWKREVIYKNRKTDMSIYYITPSNKIIESMEGISDYLKTLPNNRLTTSNFSFFGGPLGVNDPSKEIIRRLTATELPERDRDHITYSPNPPPSTQSSRIKDPKFLKPFSYGWTRELVYRATRSQPHKFIDVYYYNAKERVKLRSKIEVGKYLNKNKCKTLTVGNFTFVQDAIRPPDPMMEIIRTAVKVSERDHSTSSSRPSKRRMKVEDVKDPRFLEPFSYGWKRELVYRATPQQHKSIDVYYYTKEGEKLRSKVEIFEYLKKTECNKLTLTNFTFVQDAIKPTDPTKEIIRTAVLKPDKKRRRKNK